VRRARARVFAAMLSTFVEMRVAATDLLIVGANGFLGVRTVAAALAAGISVATFGPPSAAGDLLARWRGRIATYPGSITEPAEIAATLAATRPATVISFAAHGEGRGGLMSAGEIAPARAFAVNVDGFRILLTACAEAGVRRVLWTGSTAVFGPAAEYPSTPLDEAAARAPRTIYGLTKQLAEDVASFYRRRTGMEVCALRPPLVFGPSRWYGGAAEPLHRLLAAASRREALALRLPEEHFDLMYADDVATALLLLADHRGSLAPCYHVNGFATCYRDIAAFLARECPGFDPSLEFTRSAIVYPLISATRIARDVGFHPRFDLPAALRSSLQELAP
jgi:UDP-glucose 4-epimerase